MNEREAPEHGSSDDKTPADAERASDHVLSGGEAPEAAPAPGLTSASALTQDQVLDALRPVEDPEIGLSIVDLGLIYGVDISPDGRSVTVDMTLTTPMCPYGPELVGLAETALRMIPGVSDSRIQLVWTPRWDPRLHASEDAKAYLGIW